jgi:hypothetical protein
MFLERLSQAISLGLTPEHRICRELCPGSDKLGLLIGGCSGTQSEHRAEVGSRRASESASCGPLLAYRRPAFVHSSRVRDRNRASEFALSFRECPLRIREASPRPAAGCVPVAQSQRSSCCVASRLHEFCCVSVCRFCCVRVAYNPQSRACPRAAGFEAGCSGEEVRAYRRAARSCHGGWPEKAAAMSPASSECAWRSLREVVGVIMDAIQPASGHNGSSQEERRKR